MYDVANTGDGTDCLTELFGIKDIFENPKPYEIVIKLLKPITTKNDIILDFFSGSATMAHAVMKLNAEDGFNRKYICVQLPEKTEPNSVANKAGYQTICEIGKERIRRAGEKIKDGHMGLDPKNMDLICSLHKDKPHHLHIHFWFAEKEPKCKYRKKELEYRHKGKIEKAVIDRMHVRLNVFIKERTDKTYMTRDEALRELKRITFPKSIVSEDEVRKKLISLAKAIPKDASFFYSKKDMLIRLSYRIFARSVPMSNSMNRSL